MNFSSLLHKKKNYNFLFENYQKLKSNLHNYFQISLIMKNYLISLAIRTSCV
jgi:hypothetical protein